MTDWTVEGTLLIACNCDYGCPCNFNAYPSHGKCEGGWIWCVERGRFGDTELDGLTFSMFNNWPRAIHEGDGVSSRFIDERGDEAQREAMTRLLSGDEGGPWGIFAGTFSEVHGPRVVPVEVHLDGLATRARLGDGVELEFTTIRNPVTGAEVRPGAVLPEGLVCKEATFGASEVFRVHGPVEYDHSGQYTAIAPFAYTSS